MNKDGAAKSAEQRLQDLLHDARTEAATLRLELAAARDQATRCGQALRDTVQLLDDFVAQCQTLLMVMPKNARWKPAVETATALARQWSDLGLIVRPLVPKAEKFRGLLTTEINDKYEVLCAVAQRWNIAPGHARQTIWQALNHIAEVARRSIDSLPVRQEHPKAQR